MAAVFLLTATFLFVLWQNSQIAILWDLSYLLDTSWRIALGQVPYRGFPIVHPPLTFVLQAAIMRVAGRHYLLHVAYAALTGALGTVVSWRIILRILRGQIRSAWIVSLLLAAPLTVLGIYSIYPHPIYDCDAAFAILIAIFLLQRLELSGSGWWKPLFTSAALVVPIFFKQNMGLPFLLIAVAGICLLLVLHWTARWRHADLAPAASSSSSSSSLLKLLAGIAVASALALVLIQATFGIGNYLRWTVHFAAERRLPGFADMVAIYQQPSFAWTLPCVAGGLLLLCLPIAQRLWARFLAFDLLSAPLIGSIVFLFLDDDLDERGDNLLALWPMLLLLAAVVALIELRKGITLGRLLPFFVLAAIHGTFLSQQLWGSTYAIWPLLMLLIAWMLAAIPASARWLVPAVASVVCVTFLVCGGLYAAGHDRMNYLQIPNQPVSRASLPALRGMADRGPYLADWEELVRFTSAEIPLQDGILLLPGEEPFYFATGRTPQFPVQIFDRTTDPYSAQELIAEAQRRNIRWVILKTRLQSTEDPLPEAAETHRLIAQEFALYRKLAGYDVYRRK